MITNFPSRLEFEAVAGIRMFHFVPIEDIAYFPGEEKLHYEDLPIFLEGPITFVVGKSWLTGYASIGSASYDEQTDDTLSGEVYNKLIKGYYPLIEPEALALFTEMMRSYFIVKIRDGNGRIRILGTKKNPLTFSFSNGTGTNPGQKNGFDFSFSNVEKFPSPFYDFEDDTLPDNSYGDDYNEDYS